MVVISSIILFFIVNVLLLSFSVRNRNSSYGTEQTTITLTGPFQNVISFAIRSVKEIWFRYFSLISVAEKNSRLETDLGRALERANRCDEIELANNRLRALLDFQETMKQKTVAGEIIGKDPSPWFRSIIINKGKRDGLRPSLPVIVPRRRGGNRHRCVGPLRQGSDDDRSELFSGCGGPAKSGPGGWSGGRPGTSVLLSMCFIATISGSGILW